MSAASALQAALFARLSGDPALAALIGADGIHDRLIDHARRPSLRFAALETRDWSTASEPGEEHEIRIEARSGEGGHRQVQEIAGLVRGLLHDADLPLAGHHLVNLRHVRTAVKRDGEMRGHVAETVFRAVTEPDED